MSLITGMVASRASQAAGLGNGQDHALQATHLPPAGHQTLLGGGQGRLVRADRGRGGDGRRPPTPDACRPCPAAPGVGLRVPAAPHAPRNVQHRRAPSSRGPAESRGRDDALRPTHAASRTGCSAFLPRLRPLRRRRRAGRRPGRCDAVLSHRQARGRLRAVPLPAPAVSADFGPEAPLELDVTGFGWRTRPPHVPWGGTRRPRSLPVIRDCQAGPSVTKVPASCLRWPGRRRHHHPLHQHCTSSDGHRGAAPEPSPPPSSWHPHRRPMRARVRNHDEPTDSHARTRLDPLPPSFLGARCRHFWWEPQ